MYVFLQRKEGPIVYDLVLKGGTLVTPDDVFVGDMAVRAGKIAALGQELAGDSGRVLDVRGP